MARAIPPENPWDVSRFVSEPSEEFVCSICLCVLVDPMETRCRHCFCKACLLSWLSNGKDSCPQCKQRIPANSMKPALPAFKNVIANLDVKCENHERGCTQTFVFERYAQLHAEHKELCLFESVKCQFGDCCQKGFRQNIAEHEKNCKYREIVICRGCEQLRGELAQLSKRVAVLETRQADSEQAKTLPVGPVAAPHQLPTVGKTNKDEFVRELQPPSGLQLSASAMDDESMKEEVFLDKILALRILRGDTADEEMEDLTKLHQCNDGKEDSRSQPPSSIASPSQQRWTCKYCRYANTDFADENCMKCNASRFHSDNSPSLQQDHSTSSRPGRGDGDTAIGALWFREKRNDTKSSSRRSDYAIAAEFWPCRQPGCTSMNRNNRFTCQGCGKPKRPGGGGNVYPTLSGRKKFPVSLHDGGSTSVGYAGAGSSLYANIAKKSPQKSDSDETELIKSWNCKQCTFVNKQHKNFCEVCGATNDEADPTKDEEDSP